MNLTYQTPVEVAKKSPSGADFVFQTVLETARNVTQYLYITGAIFNNKIDTHVVSYKRYASLCNPGQKITLVLDESFPGPVDPGHPVSIYERGVKVLTGYVVRSTRSRPTYEWTIDIEDTYTRVSNYFIDQEIKFDTTQSAKFLIASILDPTGIEYRISGEDAALPPGTAIGLRSAHDALNDVMVYGSWYAWVDPNGILKIKKHANTTPIVIRDPISFEHANSTETTRNVVKVYGQQLVDGSSVNVSLGKTVPGLLVDQATVVASPLISNYDDAERVANYLLQELGSQSNVVNFEIEGNPAIQIGTSGSLYYQDPVTNKVTSGSGPITSVETTVDSNGYIMNVTVGERCPRIAGWSIDPREMRALWIAASGGAGDPRPWKLVYTDDFGVGGQPTYHIVKAIPSGAIIGMHPTLNGRRVYLIMGKNITISGATYQLCELWYSDNPYDEDVEWTRMIYSGMPTGGLGVVDYGYFGYNGIMSAHVLKNTLYLGVRYNLGNLHQFHRMQVVEQATSTITDDTFATIRTLNPGLNLAISCGKTMFYEFSTTRIHGLNVGSSAPLQIISQNRQTFGMSLRNGVGYGVSQPGGMWTLPTADAFSTGGTSTVAPIYVNENNYLVKGAYTAGTSISETILVPNSGFQNPGYFDPAKTFVRGYFWGDQVQAADLIGNLYVGSFSGGMSKVFQWDTSQGGVIESISKSKPNYLAWFPNTAIQNNEMARWSLDQGATWRNMTGNWWGTNSEVLAGTKMQSQGSFNLIDAHATFWASEID